jgi:hypothetical protein
VERLLVDKYVNIINTVIDNEIDNVLSEAEWNEIQTSIKEKIRQ